MTRRELDVLELGQHPAACLLAEQGLSDLGREHHISLLGFHAVSLQWGRALEGGRVP